MTTAWAHLPNAQHVDWVLADLKARPALWDRAQKEATDQIGKGQYLSARDEARKTVWPTHRDAAWGIVSAGSKLPYVWEDSWPAAYTVCLALLAYDECGPLLNCSLEHLQRLYRLNPHPSYLLLQAPVIVRSAS
jgi:hypothetical protein